MKSTSYWELLYIVHNTTHTIKIANRRIYVPNSLPPDNTFTKPILAFSVSSIKLTKQMTFSSERLFSITPY